MAAAREDTMDDALVIRRNPRVQARKLAGSGGAVLLNLDTAAYHGVNETGWVIWDSVGDGLTLSELLRAVKDRIEDGPPTLVDEVRAFIDALVERRLLLAGEPATVGDVPLDPAVDPSV